MNSRMDHTSSGIGHASSQSAIYEVAKRNDPLLGAVALGGLLVILVWSVTGLNFLAIVALLIALGSFVAAVTLGRGRSSVRTPARDAASPGSPFLGALRP